MYDMIYLDLDVKTGKYTPVTPEQAREESDGFNTPPFEMTRAQRQRFRTVNRKMRKTMSEGRAYFEALKAAMQVKA